MKTVYLLAILNMMFTGILVAQSPEKDLFDQSIEHFEDEEYAEAAKGFSQFMLEYARSPLRASAHYNLALSHYRMRDYPASKMFFRAILEQPYNERDENSLMEPYRLYKHNSCRQLASIALEEHDYKSAEKYIHMFDKKYPYQHFCGNEWSAYDMYKAVMMAKVYEGTGQIEKAMEQLLPYVFSNALASNDEVLDQLSTVLQKHFRMEELREEFKRAVESLEIKETRKEKSAYIHLFNVSVPVLDVHFEPEKNLSDKENYQKVIEANALFQKFL